MSGAFLVAVRLREAASGPRPPDPRSPDQGRVATRLPNKEPPSHVHPLSQTRAPDPRPELPAHCLCHSSVADL